MYSKSSINKYIKLIKTLAVVFALAFTSFAFAQEQEEDEYWFYTKEITKIEFSGLKHVKKAELAGLTSSFIGTTVQDSVQELTDRLFALELFEDIIPNASHDKGDGVILTFEVTEKPVISKISFRGNKKVRTPPLRDAVTIKADDIFIPSKALLETHVLRNVYLEKGYTDVHISYKTEETEDGIHVIFLIAEGRTTVISKIDFSGNTVFNTRTLKKQLKLKEVNAFTDGAFQELTLEGDRQAITKYYQDRGYIDAAVLDVTREINYNEEKDRDELKITFYMQEGVLYTFDSMTFTGNKIFDTKTLESKVTLKKGEVFNATKFQESFAAITDLYYENGYTANGFNPAMNKDVNTKTVSCTLSITERERSHIEKVIIRGNTKTKEDVILREIPIEAGDVFSKAKLITGLRNLYNLQYFSSVVPDTQAGSENGLATVIFNVEEQMTNSVEFGLTFSGVQDPKEIPFALFAKWSNSNVGGSGRSISANGTISSREQSVGFSYGQRWLFGLPVEFNTGLSFSHSNATALRMKLLGDGTTNVEDYYFEYEAWTTSLNTSIGHRWTKDWATFTATAGLTNTLRSYVYDDKLYTPLDTQIHEFTNKLGLTNSVWVKASLDGRDISYDPNIGYFASQQIGWYGLTPWETDFYLRTDTKLEGYVPLVNIPFTDKWSLKLILAGISTFSFQWPSPGSSVSDSNKLYLDGMFNARGWTKIYNTVKGRALWSNNLELRFPVVPGIVAIDGFFDAAYVARTPEDMFTNMKASNWYFSTGPDIRILLPQFPMRLMFANCFKIENNQVQWYDTWKFVLSFNLVNK
ncbi:MAG: outer membrane protein assembly factor BamA [Treponema sp.]|nr:outer membrane protein assembly factor BamA [Treponema sp.]